MNLKKMAATVAKPGLIPRMLQEHNLHPFDNSNTKNDVDTATISKPDTGAEPKVPPQHQRVKLADFSLVRTLGTGNSICRICCRCRMRKSLCHAKVRSLLQVPLLEFV